MWPSLLIRVLSKVFIPSLTWISCQVTPYPRRPDPTTQRCDCWGATHRASSSQWHPPRDLLWSGHDCTCEEQSSWNNCKTWIVVFFLFFFLSFLHSQAGQLSDCIHDIRSTVAAVDYSGSLGFVVKRFSLGHACLSWIISILDLWQLQLQSDYISCHLLSCSAHISRICMELHDKGCIEFCQTYDSDSSHPIFANRASLILCTRLRDGRVSGVRWSLHRCSTTTYSRMHMAPWAQCCVSWAMCTSILVWKSILCLLRYVCLSLAMTGAPASTLASLLTSPTIQPLYSAREILFVFFSPFGSFFQPSNG